jgi:hypothetical protein
VTTLPPLSIGPAPNNPPRDTRILLEKAARSVAEVQSNLDSVADVAVFLEVLGYSNKTALDYGFADLYDFARHVYEFVDVYADRDATRRMNEESLSLPIPSMAKRTFQGLTLSFPWIGSLLVLFVFGISLWLVWGMPIAVISSLIVGLFFGLLVSAGPIQMFQRIFSFNYNQGNVSETKRALKRSYLMLSVLAVGTAALLFAAGRIEAIPTSYVELAAIAAVSILINQVSYILVYSLKKFAQLVVSYTAGFTVLIVSFYLMYNIVPQTLPRYLDALGLAFATLSVLPAYYSYRVFTSKSPYSLSNAPRQTFNPVIVNSRTISSRFSVQLWENLPYYAFGTLFFVMLFGDRVLSWFFNPSHLANGIYLPLVFNTAYHLGADLALMVIFPAAVIQYALMVSVSEELGNLTMTIPLTEAHKADEFLKARYSRLLLASVLASSVVASLLFLIGPEIMGLIGGTEVSLRILQVAAISDVAMSVFLANSLFLIFLGRVKQLLLVVIAGAAIVAVFGFIFGRTSFQDIIYAYALAALATSSVSSILAENALRRPGALFFSRFI